jgi:hypothetical protein
MSEPDSGLRGFRTAFIVIGVLYALMAASALGRGVSMLSDFGVSDAEVASPVLADFFTFFYEHMAFVGALVALFGFVTRGRRAQLAVAAVFVVANLLFALRDLHTSDSRFGNHLYRGDATLVFVAIDLALAAVFAVFVVAGLRRRPLAQGTASITSSHVEW